MATDRNRPVMPPTRFQSAVEPIRNISSRHLFGDAPEIRIEHLGQIYRLRRTRNGKLILNK